MVIADDATNHLDGNTLITVSIEYNSIPSRIVQYSQIYTNWDDKRTAITPICNIMLVHCNPPICMVIIQDGSSNYEAFRITTLSSEWNILLYITSIFSNLHRMGSK
jgi:hypothetical protein